MSKSRFDLLARTLVRTCTSLALLCAIPGGVAADETPLRALTPPTIPTEVYVSLFDLEILGIDEQQETFEVEADLEAQWHDPRLAFGGSGDLADQPMPLAFEQEAASDLLQTIWWPNFELTDGRDSRDQMHLSITIYPDGTVRYYERFSATIKQSLDLQPFPFDAHDISFSVGPFSASSAAVVFLPFEADRPPISWEPSEWVVDDAELVVLPGPTCSGSGDPCLTDTECPGGETCEVGWASAQVHMSIFRVSKHYVWKIILPLALIVLISSAVFWLDLAKFPDPGDRLAISFTGVLTVVAFDFVSSGNLPKLWYNTVLDKVLLMAYVFLAINIALNVVSTQLSTTRPVACRRNDLIGRWVFPAAFLIGLWILIP